MRRPRNVDAPLTKTSSIYLAGKSPSWFRTSEKVFYARLAGDGSSDLTHGGNSLSKLAPPITCVFVGMAATLVSSCARDCVAPEAVYAQRPPAGVDYRPAPGSPPYGQPPSSYSYGSPSGSYPYGSPPGAPPYGTSPGSYPYGPPPGAQYGASPGNS